MTSAVNPIRPKLISAQPPLEISIKMQEIVRIVESVVIGILGTTLFTLALINACNPALSLSGFLFNILGGAWGGGLQGLGLSHASDRAEKYLATYCTPAIQHIGIKAISWVGAGTCALSILTGMHASSPRNLALAWSGLCAGVHVLRIFD